MASHETQTDTISVSENTASDTSTEPTPSVCSSRQLIAKFSGHKTVIRADLWINLFEVATKNQNDEQRIFNMMAYLIDDALNWFASDVAPNLDNIKWSQVRDLFIARFGPAIANPIIESQHRRLKPSETVHQYYEDKMRILRRATLNEADVVAQLTEGMPPSYRGYLLCANPANAVAWLAVALQLEATMARRTQIFGPKPTGYADRSNGKFSLKGRQTQTAFVSNSMKNSMKVSSNFHENQSNAQRYSKQRAPPTACRFCAEAGETHYHWHRDCPRRQAQLSNQQTDPQESTSSSAQANPALIADQAMALTHDLPGNFPGGRH